MCLICVYFHVSSNAKFVRLAMKKQQVQWKSNQQKGVEHFQPHNLHAKSSLIQVTSVACFSELRSASSMGKTTLHTIQQNHTSSSKLFKPRVRWLRKRLFQMLIAYAESHKLMSKPCDKNGVQRQNCSFHNTLPTSKVWYYKYKFVTGFLDAVSGFY